ncbi:hypothetical protein AT15_04215 [Kosmotoga arenicorallina S304]|uniref:Peptidase C13 n=1 Tax=Kosmotoga arenicorallina S304 TaxID=1453497 RepID=A0A176JYQ3_9BACT|nr:hypothetical protein [Kosmotoga arenicorallina]OAA29008.1 hypothetical protein AT15_04215 [Kosmotoga arenicorallina S304]
MRRKLLFSLLILAILFVLVGCPGSSIDELISKMKFIDYAFAEGEPEVPAVALYLGRVKKDDILQVYTPVPEPRSGEFIDNAVIISPTIGAPGYLYYLDLAPGAFYNHPGRIVVLGEDGEPIIDEEVEGWPVLNGQTPEPLVSPISEVYQKAIFWRNIRYRIPVIKIPEWIIVQRVQSGAVVVNGLTPTQNLYYEASQAHNLMYNAMVDFMGAEYVRQVEYPSNTQSDVEAAIQYLIETKKVNRLTLYFIAHGSYDSMNIGGTYLTASELKGIIESYRSVQFYVMIESCHAGSWLEGTSNIVDPPNTILAIATTSADKSAYPDWDHATGYTDDYNASTDVYVEWTTDFLQMMSYYTGSGWSSVTSYASTHGIANEAALYDLCFLAIKGGSPPGSSYTFTERVGIQEPRIYRSY